MKSRQLKRTKFALWRRRVKNRHSCKNVKLTYVTQSTPRRDRGTMGTGWPTGVAALRPSSIRYNRQCINTAPQTGCLLQPEGSDVLRRLFQTLQQACSAVQPECSAWSSLARRNDCRSQWLRGLRCESATDRLLGLWVRIPPDGMDVCLSCLLCFFR